MTIPGAAPPDDGRIGAAPPGHRGSVHHEFLVVLALLAVFVGLTVPVFTRFQAAGYGPLGAVAMTGAAWGLVVFALFLLSLALQQLFFRREPVGEVFGLVAGWAFVLLLVAGLCVAVWKGILGPLADWLLPD